MTKRRSLVKTQTPDSRSDDNRFLYMFVRRDDRVYLLYKIDALGCIRDKIEKRDLLPLIEFDTPHCECDFAYIEPFFYIVGQPKQDVFSLNKNEIDNLNPSKKTIKGIHYVNRITPMLGDKWGSLAFAYNNNLYVLSKFSFSPFGSFRDFYDFEVYSPLNTCWRHLGVKPLNAIVVESYLVLGTIVYFTTSKQTVISFDLNAERWSTVFDPYGLVCHGPGPTHCKYLTPRSTFQTHTQIIGNKIFGITNDSFVSYPNICASPSWEPNHDLFLRPTLAPNQQFVTDVYELPIQYTSALASWSMNIFTWNKSEGLLGVVCYGTDTPSHEHKLSNCAFLNIFKIDVDPDQYPRDPTDHPLGGLWNGKWFYYAVAEDRQHVNCFKGELLHRIELPIKTQKASHGNIRSCIFV